MLFRLDTFSSPCLIDNRDKFTEGTRGGVYPIVMIVNLKKIYAQLMRDWWIHSSVSRAYHDGNVELVTNRHDVVEVIADL